MRTWYIAPYRRPAHRHAHLSRRTGMEPTIERDSLLAVDVKSDGEAYEISAMIPGIEAEDIDVEILDKTVSIRGKFGEQVEDEERKVLVNELPFGRFSRVLTLPTKLDPSNANANLKNGVFTLRVPKAEESRPKVIEIKAE
jgi:HSP20 family protein